MVLWVGRQCMIVTILTYFWGVCGDTELTNVASGMRRDFYSIKSDHKEVGKATSDVGYEHERFCICCKNTDVRVLK